jgi:hypothetical protein
MVFGGCAAEVKQKPGQNSAAERTRIEALIAAVESSDVAFIRNGVPHNAAAAAQHLRKKWSFAGGYDLTAEQFIERVASRSSITGRPYEVKSPDGTTLKAGTWLHEKLRELER